MHINNTPGGKNCFLIGVFEVTEYFSNLLNTPCWGLSIGGCSESTNSLSSSNEDIPIIVFCKFSKNLFGYAFRHKLFPRSWVNQINKHLLVNNDSMMFVTYFLGVVDLKTGVMTYVNCGHNPPCILRADGSVSLLEECHGGPLGVFDDAYESSELRFAPGEGIYLYTDGVTEAMNPARMQFGDETLRTLLQDLSAGHTADEVVKTVLQSVREFADGAEQSDDITMLCFRFLQPRG